MKSHDATTLATTLAGASPCALQGLWTGFGAPATQFEAWLPGEGDTTSAGFTPAGGILATVSASAPPRPTSSTISKRPLHQE